MSFIINTTQSLRSPLEIGNLKMWLDASDYSTFVFGAHPDINEWKSKIKSSFTSVLGSVTKPTYTSSTPLNGKPAVRCYASYFTVSPDDLLDLPFVIMMVVSFDDILVIQNIFNRGDLSISGGFILRKSLVVPGGITCSWATNPPTTIEECTQENFESNKLYILTIQGPGTSFKGSLTTNTSFFEETTNDLTGYPIATAVNCRLGDYAGYMHEFLYFDKNFTVDEVRQMEHYLAHKWNVNRGSLS
jgi:hypothetical protein